MLKIIYVGDIPYVCGRKKSPTLHWPSFPPFVTAAPETFNDVDAIRAAAKDGAIYAAVENLLANDKYGDCTCAAALKIQAIFDCASGRTARRPSVDDALWLYGQVTDPPFNQQTGANDNGTSLQAVLKFWQDNGVYSDGTGRIKAAYSVDATNKAEVIAALNQYGVLYCGCDLPKAWEQINATGFTWGMSGAPDPNAGHCTYMYGHNETGVFDGTWGMEGTVPWDALAYYFGSANGGELYAVAAA